MDNSKQEFVSLFLLHQNMVHKICRAYCPNVADRQDLFQEIALQLWRAYPTFRGEAKESTWMYRVALNVAITHGRRSKPQAEQLTENFHQLAELADTSDGSEQMEALYKAIYMLSDVEKALVLLYFEDKSTEEIALLTGVTVGNVRVKMHRIREKLRVQIQTIPST